MADVRQNAEGGYEVKLAGSNEWKAATPEEADAYQMDRGERMLSSLGRGAESLLRGSVHVADQYLPDMRGPMAPESAADNTARLRQLQAQSEAMGNVDPRAGLPAWAPEAAGAFVPGGLPAAIGTEAVLGAARNPDHPWQGAAIGGAAGGAGVLAGRALSVGARKGLDIAEHVIGPVREQADMMLRGQRAAERRSLSAAANADVPPGQRPLEGFLTADEAEAVGIPLTKGDRLALDAADSEGFQNAAKRRAREELQRSSELADAVFTKIEDTRQGQQAWLTSRIAQELGDPLATNLTPKARERIRGDVQDVFKHYFDDAADKTQLTDFTARDLDRLTEIYDVSTPNAQNEIARHISQIEEAIGQAKNGDLPENVQQGFIAEKRSELADRAEKAFAAGNYELGSNLNQMREVVEDVLQRQYKDNPSALRDIDTARKRWRILKALERHNTTDPAGEINPRSFLNAYKAVTPRYKRAVRGARGDLEAELETLNWLTTKVQPDSGTSQRLLYSLGRSQNLAGMGGAAMLGDWLFGD
ncbi:MAG: hypothetical protein QM699_06815 [Amaricoccus sp.]|uniref:hypothetical protein n=1 Tax=Amaricoccus sp. TaxID=1872485 RepID=UPI0039E595FB